MPTVAKRPLELAAADYEVAEAHFMTLVRDSAGRTALGEAARAVAAVSEQQNRLAAEAYHAGEDTFWMPLDQLTEVTEVLADLWHDLASAYEA